MGVAIIVSIIVVCIAICTYFDLRRINRSIDMTLVEYNNGCEARQKMIDDIDRDRNKFKPIPRRHSHEWILLEMAKTDAKRRKRRKVIV